MAQDETKDQVNNVEIEPLSDEELESVAGGDSYCCCTTGGSNCSISPKEEISDSSTLA